MAMNRLDCRQIQDLLIDYSDGELEAELAARVATHLEHCAVCGAQLVRLDASLSLASELWKESARMAADVELAPVRCRPSTMHRVVIVLVSTAAALLIGLFAWQQLAKEETPLADGTESQGEVPENAVVGTENRETPIVEIDNSGQDLLALIDRVERRARLQVSLELLEQTPSLRPQAEEADHYLAAAYGDLDRVDTFETNHPSGNQEERL
jgi:hypothetical protein